MKKTTHTHHINPKHNGGTDESENLIELTIEDHANAHMKLWESEGRLEDFYAWKMLSGKSEEGESARKELARRGLIKLIQDPIRYKKWRENYNKGTEDYFGSEEHLNNCSEGGKIQGPINRDSGWMKYIRSLVNEEYRNQRCLEVMYEKMNNCFMDPIKRLTSCSKGGKIQGRINAESGHLDKISKSTAKQRSEKMKDRILINDGEITRMIHKEELTQFPGWKRGRAKK